MGKFYGIVLGSNASTRLSGRAKPLVLFAALVALGFSLGVSAQGDHQPTPAPPTEKQGAAPGDNISGVWNAVRGTYDTASFSKGDPPMTPWGEEQFRAAKPSQGPRGVSLKETTDRVYKCQPPGMPYIYLQLFPMQIVQTPKEVIELFEYDHTVRHIYTDGRKHPDNLKPSWMGHSIGHWEGDALVVDTVGLNGKTWLDRVGHPDSAAMHIVEHIRRADDKTMQVDFTFDDPKSYSKPWTAEMRFRLRPDWDILEQVCEDNRAFDDFEK